MVRKDPDNFDSGTVEVLSAEEAAQEIAQEELEEPAEEEVNLTGKSLEEGDGSVEALAEHEARNRKNRQISLERGETDNKTYDVLLDQVEEITGYDSDAGRINIKGSLNDQEMSEDEVRVQYVLDENLTSTHNGVKVPGIELFGEEALSVAYQQQEVDVMVERREDGALTATFSYEEVEDVEEAARSVGTAVGEFEKEMKEVYRLSR